MYPNIVGRGLGSPYAVTGSATVSTNATSNRIAATLSGTDPLSSSTSGITNLIVNFGSLTSDNFARSTFINDNIFAAGESPTAASQINGTSLPTTPGGTLSPRLGLVSSNAVSNSLLPSGLCSTCQFLQWGYWTGVLDTPNAAGTAPVRQDAAHINTWVAGMPSITLSATGIGTFSGNALGSMLNGRASYLPAGGFTNSYNFGTHTAKPFRLTIPNLLRVAGCTTVACADELCALLKDLPGPERAPLVGGLDFLAKPLLECVGEFYAIKGRAKRRGDCQDPIPSSPQLAGVVVGTASAPDIRSRLLQRAKLFNRNRPVPPKHRSRM
jgi:hypothetical protein